MKCLCGCSLGTNKEHKFVSGHNSRVEGYCSGQFTEGMIPWNKDLIKENDSRLKAIGEKNKNNANCIKVLSDTWIRNSFRKGKTLEEIFGNEKAQNIRTKMSISFSGEGNSFWGKTHTIETKRKIGSKSSLRFGENSPLWKGGLSFGEYGIDFNKYLKKYIRELYHNECVLCFKDKEDNRQDLIPHHIDYNKQNNKENNFVLLCRSCNAVVNFNRNFWVELFISNGGT